LFKVVSDDHVDINSDISDNSDDHHHSQLVCHLNIFIITVHRNMFSFLNRCVVVVAMLLLQHFCDRVLKDKQITKLNSEQGYWHYKQIMTNSQRPILKAMLHTDVDMQF